MRANRGLLLRVACGLLGLAWVAPPLQGAELAVLGTQTHLFVDDALLARKSGLVRRVHPCRKLPQPVLIPEKPWEGDRVYLYGTVLYDRQQEQFRMWYMGLATKGSRDPRLNRTRGDVVLYATSRDGLHWQRPALGLFSYEGSTKNNIVFDLHSPSVVFDAAEADPARRYKMVGVRREGNLRGYWAANSPDGLHWSDAPGNPIVPKSDTITLMHDPRAGEDLAFHKINAECRGCRRRLVWLTTSRDFQHWSPSELVLAPDEQDDAWVKQSGQQTDFYDLSAFPYGDQYLGLVTVFRIQRRLRDPQPNQSGQDGPIDVQLIHSRDGRKWQRCEDRSPVIPNGPHAYDAGCILGVANLPVIHGDEIWFYYTAINTTHGGALPEKKVTIARAAWRLDGFASLDADSGEGTAETVALASSGGRLVVNAEASGGSVRVELLDEQGQPLPGYSRQECLPLENDNVRQPVRWQQHDRLPSDRTVRIRFLLQKSRIYSFHQQR